MRTLAEYWPPAGVTISEGDLRLSFVVEADYVELVEAVLSGIHAPDAMPFAMPWTLEAPEKLPANSIRHFAGCWSTFTPENFILSFAVRVAGELVGNQVLHTENFPITRTGETGSWLARRFHGRGIGTRMRRAVCAFAFDELGAVEVTSGAFVDNPASLAVSRKVGYQPNGLVRLKRRDGEVAVNQKLVLTPDTFVRGEAITVTGAAALREFLGLNASPGTAP